jgi:hypothetical protein
MTIDERALSVLKILQEHQHGFEMCSKIFALHLEKIERLETVIASMVLRLGMVNVVESEDASGN